MNKPSIRIIHNLARSGGTLIAKCLGSMEKTALLSEIHPDAQAAFSFNAIQQAQKWFGLDKSIHWQKTPFIEALQLIQTHCHQRNQQLLLRDWSHVDYFGVPVTDKPKKVASLNNSLQPHFNILSVQTLRNPLDTWLSMRRLNLVRKAGITASEFMDAYLCYLQNTKSDYRLLYENFLENPDDELKKACIALELEFDENYSTKWFQFDAITGDLSNSSSLRNKPTIAPRPRKPFDPQVLLDLQASPAYTKVMKIIPSYNIIK